MLKTLRDKKMWLVSQPDHAELAGLLAANWGNDEFARAGQFASADDPEQLRVGLMGESSQAQNVLHFLLALETSLRSQGFQCIPGAGVRAATEYYTG